MTTLIPHWNILEDKGLGKLIGIIKRDSGDYHIYEKKVIVPAELIMEFK